MFFRQVADEMLSQYAYVVGCERTGEALVVDPQRDVDRYVEIARRAGLRIVAAAETHIHADFLSGCREFAERLGCRAYLSGEGGEGWEYEWAEGHDNVTELMDGDRFAVGGVAVQAVHTPGHTPEHMSFLVTDLGAGATEPMGIVSGDFVFVGDLGRPDLLESAVGQAGAMEPSARRLYASAKGVFELPEYLRIWPGHGAGSACGKALGAVPDTTVGYETRHSPALAAVRKGEDAFVEYILDGQPEPPGYFGRMKVQNRQGPPVLGGVPRPRRLTGAELAQLHGPGTSVSPDGLLVLDTRPDRAAYYAVHVPGSIYAPLDKSFPTVAGCFVAPENEIVLLCQEADVDEAVRQLIRIGLDRVAGWTPPDALNDYAAAGGPLVATEALRFPEVRRRMSDPRFHVLDVRTAAEHAASRVEGATNIAHTRLAGRTGELPREKHLVVHCLSGARASAAASFLERAGFAASPVDDLFRGF